MAKYSWVYIITIEAFILEAMHPQVWLLISFLNFDLILNLQIYCHPKVKTNKEAVAVWLKMVSSGSGIWNPSPQPVASSGEV